LFVNLLQLDVGKRAAIVVDTAEDAVAVVVTDAVVGKSFIINI